MGWRSSWIARLRSTDARSAERRCAFIPIDVTTAPFRNNAISNMTLSPLLFFWNWESWVRYAATSDAVAAFYRYIARISPLYPSGITTVLWT
jgi:hypothetical protein